jgi:hypothetical protein
MEQAGSRFSYPCSDVPDTPTSQRSLTLFATEKAPITERSQQRVKEGRKFLHETENSRDGTLCPSSAVPSPKLPTLFFHIPQPSGPMTVNQITETIVFEGASDAWFGELLPRYGHESCYDLAVQALALASWAGRGLPDGKPQRAFETMGRAITALQFRMKVMRNE